LEPLDVSSKLSLLNVNPSPLLGSFGVKPTSNLINPEK
jgi:hypothetical protein